MLFTPKGYEQLTSLSSAAGLTVPAGATRARIVATAQPVRWRDDGTSPSGTVGMYLPVNTEMVYDGDLTAIEFIETAASAVLNVSYYG